jgi:MFS family permease
MNEQKQNMIAFLWHAVLLAVTVAFTDINTVLPALILGVGGSELHLGILTGIMVGVPLAGQLLFAGFLHTRNRKKPFLLLGIYLRVFSLILLTVIILLSENWTLPILLVFLYSSLLIFTLSGAFAGVSYMDLIGKSFPGGGRRIFLLRRQMIMGLGTLVSALLTRTIFSQMDSRSSYPLLFGLSALALLLASVGFLFIREKERVSTGQSRGMREILRLIPEYLKKDETLRRYILASNLLGFGTVLLPFYVAVAKKTYEVSPTMIGNFILIQIGGMILSNFLWRRVVKKAGFKGMLRIWAILGVLVPFLALAASSFLPLRGFLPVFIFTGFYLGAQKVTADAVLLEISNDENRALYSGIFGTFNLSMALFPILLGGIIGWAGYLPVFLFISLAAGASLFIIRIMVCPVDRIKQVHS